MPRSNLLSFLADFGDVIGGMCIMDAMHNHLRIEAGIGVALILGCVYLKFYHSKNNSQ